MKAILLAAAASALSTGAHAFECPSGKEGALTPIRWSAVEAGPNAVEIRLGVQNTFDKEVRMVEGGVWFVDGLDRSVPQNGIAIDPDLRVAASGANIASMYSANAYRLLNAEVEEFTPHICVDAILFADGTKAEF